MKFKALFLALLCVVGSNLAMQPQQPASKTVKTMVQADDLCPVCQELSKNTPVNELKITNCCQNFICATCENDIVTNARNNAAQYQTAAQQAAFIAQHGYAPRNQLKAICPLCREDLTTSTATLLTQKDPLPIIDIKGKQFSLEPELAQALLKCTNLEALESHPGTLDFSSLKHKFLTQKMIIGLAKAINNPKKLKAALDLTVPRTEHVTKLNPKAFEIAHYLGAPDNILFILANEIWPYIQEQANDTELTKKYKNNLRQLARPHLASPKHLLEYLQAQDEKLQNGSIKCLTTAGTDKLSLSFSELKRFYAIVIGDRWYTNKGAEWYIEYPFCSLDGIEKLLAYLIPNHNQYGRRSIDLSKHKIENFSCDILHEIETLDLSYNRTSANS